jgi:hypothetical protein
MNRFCLSCKYEPDWNSGIGYCKLSLKSFKKEELAILRKFTNPDEVLSDDGRRVYDCTGWESKEGTTERELLERYAQELAWMVNEDASVFLSAIELNSWSGDGFEFIIKLINLTEEQKHAALEKAKNR